MHDHTSSVHFLLSSIYAALRRIGAFPVLLNPKPGVYLQPLAYAPIRFTGYSHALAHTAKPLQGAALRDLRA
jgi:hypothetical protein